MSAQALIWAANVRGLKPATKIVLIQLSERHNKDTGLCNPSIKTLAEDCEMDRTTVMRHIEVLISLGIITRKAVGGEGVGREANEYQLHMPKQETSDFSRGAKSDFATGAKSQSDGGLSRNPTGAKSHSCATLTLREPKEEPSLFGSDEPQREMREDDKQKVDEAFNRFWASYPPKRRTDRPKALEVFQRIVTGKHKTIGKTDPETILAGLARFAVSSRDPEFDPMPTTWLNGARWEQYPAPSVQPMTAEERRARMRPSWMTYG